MRTSNVMCARIVHRAERRVELTRTEFALLELLMRHAGVVLTGR